MLWKDTSNTNPTRSIPPISSTSTSIASVFRRRILRRTAASLFIAFEAIATWRKRFPVMRRTRSLAALAGTFQHVPVFQNNNKNLMSRYTAICAGLAFPCSDIEDLAADK